MSVVLSGANTHDIKVLEETLDNIIISRPAVSEDHPQNLYLDAGYTGGTLSIEKRQCTAHIRPRGEGRRETERNPNFKARRWVIEVTHTFFNCFCKLLVRFEKKAQNYLALIHFACSIIVGHKLIQVHR